MGSALFGSTAQFSNVLEFGHFTPQNQNSRLTAPAHTALIYVTFRMALMMLSICIFPYSRRSRLCHLALTFDGAAASLFRLGVHN